MSVTENHQMLENGASTAVEEHNETMAAEPGAGVHEQDETQVPPLGLKSSAGTSDSGEKRTANSEERPANVKLCLHVKEDGGFCHCPALGGRQYCYRHLRLRGQQMRMARAIAQRQPYHPVLPPLEDMNAVQAALTHVTAALTAGLLERRHAGLLLYALQQASSNLRFLARTQTQAQATLAPEAGQQATAPEVGEPQRVVEEYPEFEAEFGLPTGLDLTLPPQVAFPPPEKADTWAGLTTPRTSSVNRWTKEAIELEELENQRPHMSEESYAKQSRKVHDKIHHQVAVEMRKRREAEWEAEAARRNAKEEEKAQRWRSMDAAQQRAFMEGVMIGREEEAAERREQEARAKKPAAKVGGEEAIIGMQDGQTARD